MRYQIIDKKDGRLVGEIDVSTMKLLISLLEWREEIEIKG